MVPSGPNVPDDVFALYRYYPSLTAAILFIVLFILATSIHLYQLIRTRTWFMIPLLVGGFCKSLDPTNANWNPAHLITLVL